jgi:hypothetical protein
MRTLREIAAEIEADPNWNAVNNQAAKQALGYMKTMGSIEEPFAADPNGYGVVSSFLEHVRGWKGEVAGRVRKELRTMCGHPRTLAVC